MLRTAYVLLWFPKPTETFIFREVVNLRRFGLPLKIYSLYGPWRRDLSAEMAALADDVERIGMRGLPKVAGGVLYWLARNPAATLGILRSALFRRWSGVEKSAENLFALFAGFHLARRFEADGIEHIHAPWASGPATASWVASRLLGVPFSFTARAWDIYPPDALIGDKVGDAALVRSETLANIRHLKAVTGAPDEKFQVTYNGVPLAVSEPAALRMEPPYRLLAMGRFVAKKGYDQLLLAAKILADRGIGYELVLAGDGALRGALERQARELGIADRVRFPGFLSYDAVGRAFSAADVFVMPCVIAPSADRDGIPTVILEALMHGVPVVTTPVSGIPELIRDGETGLLVPERDPDALADAILRCVQDRALARDLAARGQAQAKAQFDPERNHRAVLSLYDAIGAA